MGVAHQLAYRALRPLLFSIDAERAHELTLAWLSHADRGLSRALIALPRFDDPIEIAGLVFPNRVGLAAGLDKEARCLHAFAAMGFGFIEVGSVAPRGAVWPEPPRLHRLPRASALINRIGLHRGGLSDLCAALERTRWPLDARSAIPVRLGINLACNADTSESDALNDYAAGLRSTARWADYYTINVSNPNASNQHVPIDRPGLDQWLAGIDAVRESLAPRNGAAAPVFLKISPDLDESRWRALGEALSAHSDAIDRSEQRWGLIVANTSARRDAVQGLLGAGLSGGLSGAPLREPVNRMINGLRTLLGSGFPIVGTGGILSGTDAIERRAAGADLIQLYTGLIYRGPDLVREVACALRSSQ